MNRWKVIAVVLVIWGLGLFMLEQATHRRLEARLTKLQKDDQEMQKTLDRMVETNNQLRLMTKNDQAAMKAVAPGQSLSAAELLTLKTAFDDIQGEVAAGKLKQLALMDAYQKMQKVLNGPAIGAIQGKAGEMPPSK